jgi:hypothetical protein
MKFFYLSLLWIVLLFQIACVSKTQPISIKNNTDFLFNEAYKYKIKKLDNSFNDTYSGKDLSIYNQDWIQVKIAGQKERFVKIDHIKKITETQNVRNGSQAKKGGLVGTSVGALLGIISGILITGSSCSNTASNPDAGACDEQKAFDTAGIAIAIPVGLGIAGISTLIGTGIGALIPKYKKQKYIP